MNKITFDFEDIDNIMIDVEFTDIDKFGNALRRIMNTSLLTDVYTAAADKVDTKQLKALKVVVVKTLSDVLLDVYSLIEEQKKYINQDENGEEVPIVDPELVFATGGKTDGT
jgi:hypothetical protein